MNLVNLAISSFCLNQMCSKSFEAGARQFHIMDKSNELSTYVKDETPYSLKVTGGIAYGIFKLDKGKNIGYNMKDFTHISDRIRLSGSQNSGSVQFYWGF